jgi:hypothetical protein
MGSTPRRHKYTGNWKRDEAERKMGENTSKGLGEVDSRPAGQTISGSSKTSCYGVLDEAAILKKSGGDELL